jgi:hypothetical protein
MTFRTREGSWPVPPAHLPVMTTATIPESVVIHLGSTHQICPFGSKVHSAELVLVTDTGGQGILRGVSCETHLAANRADAAKAVRILAKKRSA